MSRLTIFLLGFFALVSCAYAKDICYEGLGCFSDSNPFGGSKQRPFSLLPQTPEKISTKFRIFNRENPSGELIAHDHLGLSFDSSLPTKFIVHGFLHHGNKPWVLDMRDALLNAEDANVIIVDWSYGNGFPYTQATANTQVVGAEIARLIKAFIRDRGSRTGDFHIIGHSLGSHIAGYAGKRVIGLGRITALDPAGPYFENTDIRVRLSKSDANYVEVIHTDGTANLKLGLGLIQSIGHVDYYPNGGKDQPNCPQTSKKLLTAIFDAGSLNVDGLEQNLGCSHMAAVYFYTESIKNSCKFLSFPCSSGDDFQSGKCLRCGDRGCNRMGYFSSPSQDLGNLYLDTQSPNSNSFCKSNYAITLFSDNINKIVQARGKFTISLETKSGQVSSTELLDDSQGTFKPDSVETRLVSLNTALDASVESVYVSYTKTSTLLASWMYDDKWAFKFVDVLAGETQESGRFCPTTPIIQSGKTVKYEKC